MHAVDGQPAVVPDGEATARQPGVDRRHHHQAHRGVRAAGQVLEPPALGPLAGRDRGHDHERVPRLGRRADRPRLRHARAAQRPQRRLGACRRAARPAGGRRRASGADPTPGSRSSSGSRPTVTMRGWSLHGAVDSATTMARSRPATSLRRPVDRDDAAGLELDQQLGALVGRADRDERGHRRRRVRGRVGQLGDRRGRDPPGPVEGDEARRGRRRVRQHQQRRVGLGLGPAPGAGGRWRPRSRLRPAARHPGAAPRPDLRPSGAAARPCAPGPPAAEWPARAAGAAAGRGAAVRAAPAHPPGRRRRPPARRGRAARRRPRRRSRSRSRGPRPGSSPPAPGVPSSGAVASPAGGAAPALALVLVLGLGRGRRRGGRGRRRRARRRLGGPTSCSWCSARVAGAGRGRRRGGGRSRARPRGRPRPRGSSRDDPAHEAMDLLGVGGRGGDGEDLAGVDEVRVARWGE